MDPNIVQQNTDPASSVSAGSVQMPQAPTKKPKNKLPLILIIIAIIIVGCAITVILLFRGNDESTKDSRNDNTAQEVEKEPNYETITTIYDRVGIVDKVCTFGGPLYDGKGKSYTLAEMKEYLDKTKETFFYPSNPTVNKKLKDLDQWVASSAIYSEMIAKLGKPNAIIQTYDYSLSELMTGDVDMIWHCGDYYVSALVGDYTNWDKYDYKYPETGIKVLQLGVSTNLSAWNSIFDEVDSEGDSSKYEIYGRENL